MRHRGLQQLRQCLGRKACTVVHRKATEAPCSHDLLCVIGNQPPAQECHEARHSSQRHARGDVLASGGAEHGKAKGRQEVQLQRWQGRSGRGAGRGAQRVRRQRLDGPSTDEQAMGLAVLRQASECRHGPSKQCWLPPLSQDATERWGHALLANRHCSRWVDGDRPCGPGRLLGLRAAASQGCGQRAQHLRVRGRLQLELVGVRAPRALVCTTDSSHGLS
mmetsp:Transcript_101733/g.283278  ORF Transcript_101733/g.283278 Transcript_101733/m.283278 type:complete len:220 (-) Transcript_101733:140-799(-)